MFRGARVLRNVHYNHSIPIHEKVSKPVSTLHMDRTAIGLRAHRDAFGEKKKKKNRGEYSYAKQASSTTSFATTQGFQKSKPGGVSTSANHISRGRSIARCAPYPFHYNT